MEHPKIRPEGETIRCKFLTCFYGMGQAGSGRCLAKGEWWNPNCPEYKSEAEALKEWKKEDEAHNHPI